MSIAILPMASEYNWNSTTVGLIQSSFFWGYLLTQVHFCIHIHTYITLSILYVSVFVFLHFKKSKQEGGKTRNGTSNCHINSI